MAKNSFKDILFVWIVLAFCIFIFTFTRKAYGEPVYSLDTLAAPLYPKSVSTIPLKFPIRSFAETFGNFYPLAEKELSRGRSGLGVNLLWSDSHTFGDRDIPAIKRLSTKYEYLCVRYPGKIELTVFTEHNLSKPDKYLDIAQRYAPHCRIVNNPWQGSFSRKYKNEIHGQHTIPDGPYNYSYDGTNAVDSNVEAYKRKHQRAERFYLWTPRYNCRWSMADTRSRAERIRDCAKPTREYSDSVLYLTGPKGDTKLPSKWLAKSHSERHSKEDLKGDKLLLISPIRANGVILKKEGNVVARLPYYGTYQGGGYRYYHNDFGYKLGRVDVFISGKKIGNINAGFRDPTYRD